MTRELILLGVFAALMSAAPYWFLPARRRSFAVSDIATWIALAGLGGSLVALGVYLAPSLLFAIVVGTKLIQFFLWCALAIAGRPGAGGTPAPHDEGEDAPHVRWSPRGAALFALAVFLIVGTASLSWPVDGDEAYYVLIAESIIADGDVDLANQYAHPERSVTGRRDLGPQPFDPEGAKGERYARHEPFLALLLVPGIAGAGLWGAMATIALLGALAAGSMFALARESGVGRAAAIRLWPLLAFAPPFLFYATRIWPEAAGALCLSEAIRASTARRYARLALWLAALSLLQLRFAVIAAGFALLVAIADRGARKIVLILLALAALPLLAGWLLVGNPLQVHAWSELAPAPLWKYARGGFGLLLDAQAGLLFQAPLWLAAAIAALGSAVAAVASRFAARRKESPAVAAAEDAKTTAHLAALAAIPYLILLMPREEWHGGWSPPLRYLVVFAPLVAVYGGRLLQRSRAWLAPAAIWTALVAIHGVAFPWRLFHIANGESALGEWLSLRFGSDFSRLFPSFIRPNGAAWAVAILFVTAVGAAFVVRAVRRTSTLPNSGGRAGRPHHTGAALVAGIAIVLVLAAGRRPGRVVHFEDAHVGHTAGVLDPELYTVARFRFTGGWRLAAGESMRFRMAPGPAVIYVRAENGGAFAIDGVPHEVAPTGAAFIEVPVEVGKPQSTIAALRGAMTFDRIEKTR